MLCSLPCVAVAAPNTGCDWKSAETALVSIVISSIYASVHD